MTGIHDAKPAQSAIIGMWLEPFRGRSVGIGIGPLAPFTIE
jgi:hypothetical protein